jgi:hypothetical protein
MSYVLWLMAIVIIITFVITMNNVLLLHELG